MLDDKSDEGRPVLAPHGATPLPSTPYLLFSKPLLDLLVITDVVDNWLGELRLDASQPGAKVAHVFVQLLNESKRLLQLLHPKCNGGEKQSLISSEKHGPVQTLVSRKVRALL